MHIDCAGSQGGAERGEITEEHYMKILEDFVVKKTELVKGLQNQYAFTPLFDKSAAYYKKGRGK